MREHTRSSLLSDVAANCRVLIRFECFPFFFFFFFIIVRIIDAQLKFISP